MISNMPGLLSPTRHRPSLAAAVYAALAALVAWGFTCSAGKAVTIDMVPVGNPGNAPDATGLGAVDYPYQIGKYVVTIGQYTEFLNAVAKTDTYGLWRSDMFDDLRIAGIFRAGDDGEYIYTVMDPAGTKPPGASSPGNRPITYISWFNAARFANWMSNGQGSDGTETGAYTLNGVTSGSGVAKNPGAAFYIPTANEWYKAGFYDPTLNSGTGGYWAYATRSNDAPGNTIGSGTNQANYIVGGADGKLSVTQSSNSDSNQNYLTDVGAFSNSASYYGTFDQSGNVYQWNDWDGTGHGLGGFGFLDNDSTTFSLPYSTGVYSAGNVTIGFRLASPPVAVPEPATWAMGLAAGACIGWRIVRRSR